MQEIHCYKIYTFKYTATKIYSFKYTATKYIYLNTLLQKYSFNYTATKYIHLRRRLYGRSDAMRSDAMIQLPWAITLVSLTVLHFISICILYLFVQAIAIAYTNKKQSILRRDNRSSECWLTCFETLNNEIWLFIEPWRLGHSSGRQKCCSVPIIDAAFRRCKAMSIRWQRNAADLGSPVIAAVLLPNSLTKEMASGPHTPSVSTAAGLKSCMGNKAVYFATLRVSASEAADPCSC